MKLRAALALAGIVVSCVGVQIAGSAVSGADVRVSGFTQPFAGDAAYEALGPPKLSHRKQLHVAVGRKRADKIAALIGLRPEDAFTKKQYLAFISGGGNGGDPASAELVDESVRIFTNTRGRPLVSNDGTRTYRTVLGSYGLFVDEFGNLQSLANDSAPTRKANSVLGPGNYMESWCALNGCTPSIDALRHSAYSVEIPYGTLSQQISEPAELVTNRLGGVDTIAGMSMVPPIWIVNFALLYILRPAVAAEMPAYWAPIPTEVAAAISATTGGQVPYSKYAKYLR